LIDLTLNILIDGKPLSNLVCTLNTNPFPRVIERQADPRQAEMGLGTQRSVTIKRFIHESTGNFDLMQLLHTEEWVNGENKGELGEVLVRCNNILYVRAAP
jgi:hypothetical protein